MGVNCIGERSFSRWVPCRYTTGKSFHVALALSMFLGVLGIDRFVRIMQVKIVCFANELCTKYLGYVGTGILKLCTLGYFGIGYWIDVVLIATQMLGPADGSMYSVGYNGPRMTRLYTQPDGATTYLDYY